METMLDTRAPLLTKLDRCDACGAAAAVRITTKELGVWTFCGHHADKHAPAIRGIIKTHDERNPLPITEEEMTPEGEQK